MSYKVHLWDALDAIQWSQASWLVEGSAEAVESCDEELIKEVLLAHVPKDGVTVDAGCGTSRWPIYLRRTGRACVGVEISLDACRMARTLDPNMPVAQGDTRHAPVRDGVADAVISLGVVEHEEAGPIEGLRELHRMLKPGGVLVLAVPFNNWWRRLIWNHLMNWVTWRRRRAGMSLGFAEYRFTEAEVRGFLQQTGFTPLTSHPNDLRAPKLMGLWVDFDNLIFRPQAGPKRLFILGGLRGRIGRWVLKRFPWLVCGEIVVVARRRG